MHITGSQQTNNLSALLKAHIKEESLDNDIQLSLKDYCKEIHKIDIIKKFEGYSNPDSSPNTIPDSSPNSSPNTSLDSPNKNVGTPVIDNINDVLNNINVDTSTIDPVFNTNVTGNNSPVGNTNGASNGRLYKGYGKLNNVPSIEINDTIIIDSKKDNKIFCSICQDYITEDDLKHNVDVLDCGHVFHKTELMQWLEYSDLCPICKKENNIRE